MASIDLNRTFSVLSFPFLLTPATKSKILRVENGMQMRREQQATFFHSLFRGVQNPYLELNLRRDHVLLDTICQLQDLQRHDLRKQLRVRFMDEPAIDEGGVQREFFHLLSKQVFDPDYGMFRVTKQHGIWFQYKSSFGTQCLKEYELLGKLLGLAIYNSVLLNLRFPLAFYKLLLDKQPNLMDLAEIEPELYSGFKSMMEFDPDQVEETFCRNFQTEVTDAVGNVLIIDLDQKDPQKSLTGSNREEYLKKYLNWFFFSSIDIQFKALRLGFDIVAQNASLKVLFF